MRPQRRWHRWPAPAGQTPDSRCRKPGGRGGGALARPARPRERLDADAVRVSARLCDRCRPLELEGDVPRPRLPGFGLSVPAGDVLDPRHPPCLQTIRPDVGRSRGNGDDVLQRYRLGLRPLYRVLRGVERGEGSRGPGAALEQIVCRLYRPPQGVDVDVDGADIDDPVLQSRLEHGLRRIALRIGRDRNRDHAADRVMHDMDDLDLGLSGQPNVSRNGYRDDTEAGVDAPLPGGPAGDRIADPAVPIGATLRNHVVMAHRRLSGRAEYLH